MTPTLLEGSYLRAIANDPEADEPRLEYAAWCLRERGEDGKRQSDFIWAQVVLARLDPGKPGPKDLRRLTDLLARGSENWFRPLTAAGWVVSRCGRGLPSEVEAKSTGDLRPDALLSGVERMRIPARPDLTAVVTELCLSEWTDGVRALVLPDTLDPLAAVSLARSDHFRHLRALHLPLRLLDRFTTALRWAQVANEREGRPPPLPRLRIAGGVTASFPATEWTCRDV